MIMILFGTSMYLFDPGLHILQYKGRDSKIKNKRRIYMTSHCITCVFVTELVTLRVIKATVSSLSHLSVIYSVSV